MSDKLKAEHNMLLQACSDSYASARQASNTHCEVPRQLAAGREEVIEHACRHLPATAEHMSRSKRLQMQGPQCRPQAGHRQQTLTIATAGCCTQTRDFDLLLWAGRAAAPPRRDQGECVQPSSSLCSISLYLKMLQGRLNQAGKVAHPGHHHLHRGSSFQGATWAKLGIQFFSHREEEAPGNW